MKIIPLSELKGKTIKDIGHPGGGGWYIRSVDNCVVALDGANGQPIDNYEDRRESFIQNDLISIGFATKEELQAEIAAEEREKDLAQFHALKAKLGL